jgi:hypothetical protein
VPAGTTKVSYAVRIDLKFVNPGEELLVAALVDQNGDQKRSIGDDFGLYSGDPARVAQRGSEAAGLDVRSTPVTKGADFVIAPVAASTN